MTTKKEVRAVLKKEFDYTVYGGYQTAIISLPAEAQIDGSSDNQNGLAARPREH